MSNDKWSEVRKANGEQTFRWRAMRHRFERRRKKFLAEEHRDNAQVKAQFQVAANDLREATITLAVWVEQQRCDSTPVIRVMQFLREWGRYSDPTFLVDQADALASVAILLERIVYRQIAELPKDELEKQTHTETLREKMTQDRKAKLVASWTDPDWHKIGRSAQAKGLGCDAATVRRDFKELGLWPVVNERSIDPDPELLSQDLKGLGLNHAT